MTQNDTFETIWEKLKSSKNVLMSLHAGPDGDSLGSCTAMKYLLEQNTDANVTVISKDPLASELAELAIAKEVTFDKDIAEIDLAAYDALVCLDTGSEERIGTYKPGYVAPRDAIFIINIDHHVTNNRYGHLNYVDGDAPSACSILTAFCQDRNIPVDGELATRLMTGVSTDSVFFTVTGRVERIFTDAAYLMQQGARYGQDIVLPIRLSIPMRTKQFFAAVGNNAVFDEQRKVAYSCISTEIVQTFGVNMAEIRQGIYQISDIKGADCVFTLVEFEGYIKGSFRTSKDIDVSLLAQELGGGGHTQAAAFRLEGMTLEEAKEKVLAVIDAKKTW